MNPLLTCAYFFSDGLVQPTWIKDDQGMYRCNLVDKYLKTIYTPQKINMEPENPLFEKEKHLPNHHFQGLC